MRTYKVVVIPGDGIGPELVEVTVQVLTALQERDGGFRLDLEYHEAGATFYQKAGTAMSEETVEACRRADSILKGPVGHPNVRTPQGTEAGILGGILRRNLDLFANVRPIKLWPGIEAPIKATPGEIDYVIIRENTEGLYASRNLGVGNDWAMTDTLLMTRPRSGAHCALCLRASESTRWCPQGWNSPRDLRRQEQRPQNVRLLSADL